MRKLIGVMSVLLFVLMFAVSSYGVEYPPGNSTNCEVVNINNFSDGIAADYIFVNDISAGATVRAMDERGGEAVMAVTDKSVLIDNDYNNKVHFSTVDDQELNSKTRISNHAHNGKNNIEGSAGGLPYLHRSNDFICNDTINHSNATNSENLISREGEAAYAASLKIINNGNATNMYNLSSQSNGFVG